MNQGVQVPIPFYPWWATLLSCAPAIAIAAFFTVASCVQAPKGADEAVEVVRTSSKFLVMTEPLLAAVYEQSQRECLQRESREEAVRCVETVRAQWADVRAAMKEFRRAWCALDAAVGEGKCPP